MKERPILFSGLMVRAILDGRKTQTRRIVKPQPHSAPIINGSASGSYDAWPNGDSCLEWDDVVADTAYYVQAGFCPYGQPGDQLWVRETWRESRHGVEYRADTHNHGPADGRADAESQNWRPSIFMPRAHSRITLEIVSARVERVQDISAADKDAEGLNKDQGYGPAAFESLWNDINAKRGYGWAVNPWVWVVEFKQL